MANSFKEIEDGAERLVQNIKKEVTSLNSEISTLNKNVFALLNSNGASDTKLNGTLKSLRKEIDKLNESITKQSSKEKELLTVKTQLNKKTSEEVIGQRALAKASDLEAQSKSKIVGAYQRLNAQRNISKKRLQDLIVSQGRNTNETKKAQKEYDRLTAKVNQANKATSNFSKTGLGGAVKGLKNLVMAFGVVGGVQLFAQMAKDVFELTKKLDGLSFAMQKIIPSSFELQQTTQFLKETTNAYGTEIVSTTERYIKFLAAAKQSNLSLGATEKIFGTVTKAAGVLGLKTDELTGVYLALEQMLSKGKVTTEELRRQLGERLPGAFGIMANAVGVTVSELDNLLKKGEILSAEALPKFADALEVAYGIESVTKVDTLVAAQNRLNNAWVEFVQDLNASSAFKDTLNFLAKNLSSILNITFKLLKGFIAYKAVVVGLNLVVRGYAIVTAALASAKILLAAGTAKATIAMRAFNFATKMNPITILIGSIGLAVAAFVAFKDGVIETSQALKDLEKQMFEVSKTVVENELRMLDSRTERIKQQSISEKESNAETLKLLDKYELDVISGNISIYSTKEELAEFDRKREEEDFVKSKIALDNSLGKTVLSYKEAAEEIQKAKGKFRLATSEETAPEITAPFDNAQLELLAEIERRRKALRDLINKQASDDDRKRAETLRKDAFELARALLKIEIEKQKDIIDNEEDSLENRLNANAIYLEKKKSLIELEASFETNTPKITSFKIKQIEAEKQDELTRLTKEGADNRNRVIEEDFKKTLNFYEKVKEASDLSIKQDLTKYRNQLIDAGTSREEIEKRIVEREKELRKESLINFIENEIEKVKAKAITSDNMKQIAKELADLEAMLADANMPDSVKIEKATTALKDFFQEFQDEFAGDMGFQKLNEFFLTFDKEGKSMFDNLLENADEGFDKFAVYFNSISEVAQEAFNFINQQSQLAFDAEFSRLEQQRDIALQFAGESAEGREEIERQYEERRKAIARRQAQAQKDQAIFNIGIDTAQAVMSIWANSPDPTGISQGALTAIIGGIGLAKMAIVAATPVPEFFRGTMNAPEGWAMVDEKGPEIHTDRAGNIKSTGESKANLRFLEHGDKVYPHQKEHFNKELSGIMGQNDILPYNQMMSAVSPSISVDSGLKKDDFMRGIKSLKSTIESKEGSVVNIDKNGFSTKITSNGKTRDIQNNILRLKNRTI
jgi:tape measure domain-containing protein